MQLSKLCLATKKFLSAMVITTTVLSTTPIQTINFKKSETNVSAATKKEVQGLLKTIIQTLHKMLRGIVFILEAIRKRKL